MRPGLKHQVRQSATATSFCLLLSTTILFLSSSSAQGAAGSGSSCRITFAKMAGFAPSLDLPAPPLYSSTYGHAITAECYNKCKADTNCTGFVLDYAKATCYKVQRSSYSQPYGGRVLPDPGVSYFIKQCLSEPDECGNRAWVVDITPGYELMTNHHTVLPSVHSWWECSERCIRSAGCRSASHVQYSDTCSLSHTDSWADPQALAPTLRSSTDYLDNQCLPELGKYCWHEPVYNQSNIRIDLSYDGGTRQQCESRCETNTYFKCVGYTWLEGSQLSQAQCHLHSDSALSPVGPLVKPTLTPHRSAVYYERIRCTNVTVSCDSSELLVRLQSSRFKGQMYVEGRSDRCSVLGSGQDVTTLRVPLQGNPCDVQVAYAFSRTTNRSMVSAVIVVQYHRQVQLVGDAVVRVSCYLGTSESQPSPTNVTVGTSVSVNTQAPQTEVTGSGNGTVAPPTPTGHLTAHMRIVDERTDREVTTGIQIGDPLQLQITVDPPYNVSYVRAGHLVAKTGSSSDETLLLLDWEGCPPDPKIFPGLKPVSSNQLVGDFKAFRFPSSPVLMLSVFLTFCPAGCPVVDCGNGVQSYGRKRRQISSPSSQALETEEIPLQAILVVNDRSDNHITEPGSLEVDPDDKGTGEICLSFVALSLFALLFLLIQAIILVVVCWYLGKRERETADTISLRRDFNEPQPLSHHVTWADQLGPRPSSPQRQVTLT